MGWALERALGAAGRQTSLDAPWFRDAGVAIEDDDELRVPRPGELAEWLDRAWEGLVEPGSKHAGPGEAWVEVAATVECWAADGGLQARRSRMRAWAMVRLRSVPGVQGVPRPVLIGSRRWQELAEDGWRQVVEDRWVASHEAPSRHPVERPLLLVDPECSATLVAALVKSLHGPGRPVGLPVGPGWKVVDDPLDGKALFGGTFDDSGFQAAPKTLSDGREITGLLNGAGHFRRPSFRDYPAALASHLVVAPGGAHAPEEGILVSTLRLHALEPGMWGLEIEGAWLESGQPGPALRRCFIRTSPEQLALSCLAAVGPARSSHRGVRTPALLFEGLEVQVGT